MAGVWFFVLVATLAIVGGIGVGLNKVAVGGGFLLASVALLAAGFFL